MNYYNENNPEAAEWIRELISARLIPPGRVDERSIAEVTAADLDGFAQHHFFAGIAGWPLALRLAGWPDDRAIATGSCPCPPFSVAGKKKQCPECSGSPLPCPRRTGYFLCSACGHAWFADGRHLWPEFWRLIAQRRFPVVVGEQVAGADGLTWLAGIRASMEILGYAFGASDLCAAGAGEKRAPVIVESEAFLLECAALAERRGHAGIAQQFRDAALYVGQLIAGAPHIRQRLFWVAVAPSIRHQRGEADANALGDSDKPGSQGRLISGDSSNKRAPRPPSVGSWSRFALAICRDTDENGHPKASRIGIKPASFPLAHELPGGVVRGGDTGAPDPQSQVIWPLAQGEEGRAMRLRGYGNAIVPELAKVFLETVMEILE